MGKAIIVSVLLVTATPALAQAATAAPPVHIRGTIVSTSGDSMVVNTGSATQKVAFAPHARFVGVVKSSLDKVAAGDFIGTAVAVEPNGSIQALEVHIFPSSLKGIGEGYYPWDKEPTGAAASATAAGSAQPRSMMANATVQHVGAATGGRTVRLVYKGGTQSVFIPPNVPVVAFQAGTRSLVVPGAHVFVNATRTGSRLVAGLINVGANGVVPPM